MGLLQLRIANDLPRNAIEFIAERLLSHRQPTVWLWANTHADGFEILKQLRHELGDKATRLVKTHGTLYLRGGGSIEVMLPKDRPDGEHTIAVWMATSEIPEEYRGRLLCLGQCEEFWARPGTVPMCADGTDWREGSVEPASPSSRD